MVGFDCLVVDAVTDNFLDLVTPTSILNITSKGPLADTPVLDGTVPIVVAAVASVTLHARAGTPVALSSDTTKVTTARAGQVDADVV